MGLKLSSFDTGCMGRDVNNSNCEYESWNGKVLISIENKDDMSNRLFLVKEGSVLLLTFKISTCCR
ncbi:hypothetical protein QQP08_012167 [Theobroma cacao]|nr:hypothetical protein QQP08_012167 [Theobroma cacao]